MLKLCIKNKSSSLETLSLFTEPEFVNVEGAQESIIRINHQLINRLASSLVVCSPHVAVNIKGPGVICSYPACFYQRMVDWSLEKNIASW